MRRSYWLSGREAGESSFGRFLPALVLFLVLLSACGNRTAMPNSGVAVSSDSGEQSPGVLLNPAEEIRLSISIYILDAEEDADLSSQRTGSDLEDIFERVNQIWAPAGIRLEVDRIRRLPLPTDMLRAIHEGNLGPFLLGPGREVILSQPQHLIGFYARWIGGPNGIHPQGTRVFFVSDDPTVHDERVSAHEIGHILGLPHTLEDEGRLLYPGTNGMLLTDEEIAVARRIASDLLPESP